MWRRHSLTTSGSRSLIKFLTAAKIYGWACRRPCLGAALAELAAYIEERVTRSAPLDCFVVNGSTPVVSFGRLESARVATLGLNPSKREFLDSSGHELDGEKRRFESRRSLSLRSLDPTSSSGAQRIVDACDRYFLRSPYRRWFDQLEPMVRAAGASYYEGTACHLDLVQWATNPTWAKLSDTTKRRLLMDDVPFLRRQIAESQIRTLLLNGRSVIVHSTAALGVQLREVAHFERTTIYLSNYSGKRLIAWSINIQSSFGVTAAVRRNIAQATTELCTSNDYRAANSSAPTAAPSNRMSTG